MEKKKNKRREEEKHKTTCTELIGKRLELFTVKAVEVLKRNDLTERLMMEEGGAGDRIRIRMIEMKGFENPRRRQIHDRLVTDED